MIQRISWFAILLSGLLGTTGCKCWQGFFKGDLCAECDPYGGGTFYCGEGCGDRYQGDWISHPPDGCEPCDRHGNFAGRAGHIGASYGPHELPAGYEGEYSEGEIIEAPSSHVVPASHSGQKCSCGHH